jgi:hypothetical protein
MSTLLASRSTQVTLLIPPGSFVVLAENCWVCPGSMVVVEAGAIVTAIGPSTVTVTTFEETVVATVALIVKTSGEEPATSPAVKRPVPLRIESCAPGANSAPDVSVPFVSVQGLNRSRGIDNAAHP